MPTYLILMRRFGAEMFVPPAKLQEYLDDGWTEIERKPQTEEEPVAPAAPVAAETAAPSPPRPKGKSKITTNA